MALKMLAAYYSCGCNSMDLFKGFKIEHEKTFEENLNQYDVIYLNMQQFLIEAQNQDIIDYLQKEVLGEIYARYGEFLTKQETFIAMALRKIHVKTDRKFIVLIDEWDCVMREREKSENLQKRYLDFLRNLLKDQSYVALAYMTGILPVKKIRIPFRTEYVYGIFHDRSGCF